MHRKEKLGEDEDSFLCLLWLASQICFSHAIWFLGDKFQWNISVCGMHAQAVTVKIQYSGGVIFFISRLCGSPHQSWHKEVWSHLKEVSKDIN